MKKKFVKLVSILMLSIAILCPVGENSNVKAATWKKDGGSWFGGKKYPEKRCVKKD